MFTIICDHLFILFCIIIVFDFFLLLLICIYHISNTIFFLINLRLFSLLLKFFIKSYNL